MIIGSSAAADPEGEDINMLSAALAGAQELLVQTQGAGDTLRGFRTKGQSRCRNYWNTRVMMQGRGFFTKVQKI
jgi:hypothetical protein